jgi:hypothetical protein
LEVYEAVIEAVVVDVIGLVTIGAGTDEGLQDEDMLIDAHIRARVATAADGHLPVTRNAQSSRTTIPAKLATCDVTDDSPRLL